MTSWKKKLCITLAMVLVTVGIVAASLTIPSVQRKVALLYCKQKFDFANFEKIKVRPRSIDISMLSLQKGGCSFKVSSLKLKWSLWKLISDKKVIIDDIDIDGFSVDFAKNMADEFRVFKFAPAKKKEPYQQRDFRENVDSAIKSALKLFKPCLPTNVEIGHIVARGRVSYEEVIFSNISMECSKIAPSTTSKMVVDVRTSVENFGEKREERFFVDFGGNAVFAQDKNGTINDIDTTLNCKFRDTKKELASAIGGRIKLTNTEKNYQLTADIGSINGGSTVSKNIVVIDKNAETVSLNCSCNITSNDIQNIFSKPELTVLPVKRTQGVPKFNLLYDISGKIDAKSLTGKIDITATADLGAEIVSILSRYIETDVAFTWQSSLKMDNDGLSIDSLELSCDNAEHTLQASIRTARPIAILDRKFNIALDQSVLSSGEDIVKCNVEHVNFGAINTKTFFKNKQYSLDADASWNGGISYKNGTVYINTADNNHLLLRNISVYDRSEKIVDGCTMACSPKAEISASKDVIKIEANDISFNSAKGTGIAYGNIAVSSTLTNHDQYSIDGYAIGNLYEMSRTRILPKYDYDISGTCSCQLAANWKDSALSGKVEFSTKDAIAIDLTTASQKTTETPVTASGSCTFSADNGTYDFHIPLTTKGKHASSVCVDVHIGSVDLYDKRKATVYVNGDELSICDTAVMCNVLDAITGKRNDPYMELDKMSEQKVRKLAAMRKKKIINPFVTDLDYNIDGEVAVNILKLPINDELSINGLACDLSMCDSTIELKSLDFIVENAPCHISGKLSASRSTNKNQWDYLLEAGGTCHSDDVSGIFKSIQSDNGPFLTGSAKGKLTIKSESKSIDCLLRNAAMSANVQLKKGNIHQVLSLNKKVDFWQNLFGTVAGISNKGKSSNLLKNAVYYADELRKDVQDIKYDTIDFTVKSEDGKKFYINRCDVAGPELRVTSKGSVTKRGKYKDILNWPLALHVDIGAAGKLGEDLDGLGLITYKKSKYMQGPRFPIGGTIGHPDFSELKKLLPSTVLNLFVK